MSAHDGQKHAWEEGIALGVLEELGDPDPPINAFAVADAAGYGVTFTDIKTARVVGKVIEVNRHAPEPRQHGLVIHEVGHIVIRRAGERDTEAAVNHVAGAIMLPRRVFDRDLRESRWDLRLLRPKHMYVSWEMMARRIPVLRDACVTIWDNGKIKDRICSPWLGRGFHRISSFEKQLAREVLESGETQEAGNLLWAFAVFDHVTGWKRVITVCEAEQLSLRF